MMKLEVAYRTTTVHTEFKVEAVRLVHERGVSVAQVSRDLDVHKNVLHKWFKQFVDDPRKAFPGHES